MIFLNNTVARLILNKVRCSTFKPNDVDADIVVIVHDVLNNAKTVYISINRHCFAGSQLQVVQLILDNGNLA
ncbi:hypothetical protein D3C76_1690000 [compost metagenome]